MQIKTPSVSSSNPGAAMDIEAGMPPPQDKLDYFFQNLFTTGADLTTATVHSDRMAI